MARTHLTLNSLLHHGGFVQHLTEGPLGRTNDLIIDSDAFLGPRAMLIAERSGSFDCSGGGYVPSMATRSVEGFSGASAVSTSMSLSVIACARLHVPSSATTSAAKYVAGIISGVCQASPHLALELVLALVVCGGRDIGLHVSAGGGATWKLAALSMSVGARNMRRNALAGGIRVELAWEGVSASRNLGAMEGEIVTFTLESFVWVWVVDRRHCD